MKEKENDKQANSTTSEAKADNATVYKKPTVEQKTAQGEGQADEDQQEGHEYKNTLPPKESGQKTTDGFNEV